MGLFSLFGSQGSNFVKVGGQHPPTEPASTALLSASSSVRGSLPGHLSDLGVMLYSVQSERPRQDGVCVLAASYVAVNVFFVNSAARIHMCANIHISFVLDFALDYWLTANMRAGSCM